VLVLAVADDPVRSGPDVFKTPVPDLSLITDILLKIFTFFHLWAIMAEHENTG
jgi:hypothetical protein